MMKRPRALKELNLVPRAASSHVRKRASSGVEAAAVESDPVARSVADDTPVALPSFDIVSGL